MVDGWHDIQAYVSNCGTTSNHGTLIQNSYNGTPFQIWIPDVGYYIYKRYNSGSIGGTWTKIYAGYADSAGSVAWENITSKPSTFTPSDHTHSYLPLSGGTLSGNLTMSSGCGVVFSGTAGAGTGSYAIYSSSNLFLAANQFGSKIFLESTYQSCPYFRNQNGDYPILHEGNHTSLTNSDIDAIIT